MPDSAFPYVHLNHDGTARELTDSERACLSAEYRPDDGDRPYVKVAVGDLDGRGRSAGFIARAALPPGMVVRPVKRTQDAWAKRRLPFETHAVRMDSRFPLIYVNHDGSAREVSPDEQAYLTAEYAPGDGNRPYVKDTYGTLTPYGFRSGFMHRARLPPDVPVRRVNPQLDGIVEAHRVHPVEESIRLARLVGDLVTPRPDGTVLIAPNPDLSTHERMERHRRQRREADLERESWARHPDDGDT